MDLLHIIRKLDMISRTYTNKTENLLHKALLLKGTTPNSIREIVRDQPELLNGVNSLNGTPLHVALLLYHCPRYDIIYELLRLGANVQSVDMCQNTPLKYVVRKYFYEMTVIMQCLLKYNRFLKYLNVKVHRMDWEDFLYNNANVSTIISLLDGANSVSFTDVIYLKHCLNNMPRCIAAVKLLLEFGANSIILAFNNVQFLKYSTKLSKLLIQYSTMQSLRYILSKSGINILFAQEVHDLLVRDRITVKLVYYLQCCDDLATFRLQLVQELVDMMNVKIDANFSLFSFVSEHCSSGLSYKEMKMPTMVKILCIFRLKQYICSYDLIDASLKHNRLLSFLHELDIYVKIPFSQNSIFFEEIRLPSLVVSCIVEYLSKEDIINLILAYYPLGEYEEGKVLKTYSMNQMEFKKKCCISLNDMKAFISYVTMLSKTKLL